MEWSVRPPIRWWLLLLVSFTGGCAALRDPAVPPSALAAPTGNSGGLAHSGQLSSLHQDSLEAPAAGNLPGCASEPSASPFKDTRELTVDAVVEQVLARNPSLAQMTAAWQAASARYQQVTSLDDP